MTAKERAAMEKLIQDFAQDEAALNRRFWRRVRRGKKNCNKWMDTRLSQLYKRYRRKCKRRGLKWTDFIHQKTMSYVRVLFECMHYNIERYR